MSKREFDNFYQFALNNATEEEWYYIEKVHKRYKLLNSQPQNESPNIRQNEDDKKKCDHVWVRTGDPDKQSVRCSKCGLLSE